MTKSTDSTNLLCFADGVRAKAQKLLADTEVRVASPKEWADLLLQVRIAWRTVSLQQLGSFAQIEQDQCAAIIDSLGRAADYLSTIGKVLDAAYAIMLDGMTREGEPLADLI